MRKIYKKLIILFISIIALLVFQGTVSARTFPYESQAYEIEDDLFCMDQSKALLFIGNGESEDYMDFSESSISDPEPSSVYAAWVSEISANDPEGVQNAVWASMQWNNPSTVLESTSPPFSTAGMSDEVEARSYQYGTVYYKIFSQLGSNPLFTITYNDLKMMVDQNNKTYTIGPYKLTVNAGDDESKQILYNEIIGTGNQAYSDATRFAEFKGISGLDGTNPIFLNSSRNQIDFPDFVNDEEFEDLKRKKEIIVTFEMLGYKYGYPRKEMESNKNSVVELHYPIIYQLKKEVKNTFSIYMIPKDIEIAKQNLKQRKLNPKIEKDRLKEIEEHVKNFKANKELREQFDYIFYNDYTENSVNKLIDILKNKCMKKVII